MMSIAAAYAAHLVPERMTGRAISFVFGGTSLGSVLGVPGTAAISHFASWRVALYVISGLAAMLTIFIALYLPPFVGRTPRRSKFRLSAPRRLHAFSAS